MTAAWVESLLKALLIGINCTWAARILSLQINQLKGKMKILFSVLSLLPLTLPPLLPAYSYSAFSFNFQTQAFLNEVLYCLIMIFKIIPIGVILFLLIPTSLSKSSVFCESLLRENLFSKLHKYSQAAAIFALLTLFAFHDYETASLMRINHWTVVLFNAHAGGLVMNLHGSMQMILLPLLTSFTLVVFTFLAIRRCRGPKFTEAKKNHISTLIVYISLSILLIFPLFTLLGNSLGGFKEIFSGNWMLAETSNSLALTTVSTICCLILSFGALQFKKIAVMAAIPGLFGALILGLIFISLFNLPLLNTVKQTIIPLSLALIVYGMPFSLLICIAIKSYTPARSLSLELLGSQNRKALKWETVYLSSTLATIPLFCYLWFDLTLSSMLAPASVTTLFPRLYNLMHYSENEKLSATVVLTALIPFTIYCILYTVCKTRVTLLSRTSVK